MAQPAGRNVSSRRVDMQAARSRCAVLDYRGNSPTVKKQASSERDTQMKTTRDYLDAVSARLGGVSDYRVAITLGISTQAVSRWRSGQDSIGDDAAIKVAQILGIDPAEILLSSYAAKSKNALARAALENAIRKLGGMAAALVLSCFALFSSSDVSAHDNDRCTNDNVGFFVLCKVVFLTFYRAVFRPFFSFIAYNRSYTN